jgi:hypothetical protein
MNIKTAAETTLLNIVIDKKSAIRTATIIKFRRAKSLNWEQAEKFCDHFFCSRGYTIIKDEYVPMRTANNNTAPEIILLNMARAGKSLRRSATILEYQNTKNIPWSQAEFFCDRFFMKRNFLACADKNLYKKGRPEEVDYHKIVKLKSN